MNIRVFKTNAAERFVETTLLNADSPADVTVEITDQKKQTIIGYGGAFTDASASLYATLPEVVKKEFNELYFGDDGLRYNLGRVTIGSCDFSVSMYDYGKKADLSDFSIVHDEKEIIPMILDANEKRHISLLASCWSPLARWKTNFRKDFGGKLRKKYYKSHADYMARFVKEYRDRNIDISAISIQNEPAAKQTWESCIYSAQEEGEMAKLLHERLPDAHIYFWDHNRDAIVERVEGTLSVEGVKDAVYGVAYHWYDGDKNAELAKVREAHPDLHILFTEGCVELMLINPKDTKAAMGTFVNGARYARNYLKDINYGSEGFLDWNLLLDLKGGPNHVGNFCEAPIITDGSKLYPTYSYYFIKHISAFIREGATVLANNNESDLIVASALNKDGSIASVILNEGAARNVSVLIKNKPYNIYIENNEIISLEVPQ